MIRQRKSSARGHKNAVDAVDPVDPKGGGDNGVNGVNGKKWNVEVQTRSGDNGVYGNNGNIFRVSIEEVKKRNAEYPPEEIEAAVAEAVSEVRRVGSPRH